jgi:peptide/nickel transport system substrate-binding protein
MALEEQELRAWVRRVANGQASRRHFMRTMLGLGLSGPLLADLLATYAPAAAQGTGAAQPTFTPTRRGGGGKLRLLFWEAPTILNDHFASGGKDREASRIVYEPLFSIDPEGQFIPILAAEIPSVENGGRALDGTWTLWRLKPGDVARYEINPHYHVPNRPFFDTVELKGGGDATSAARAVLQTGQFDYARSVNLDKDVMERLAQQGRKGAFHIVPGTLVAHIQLNRTDPWTEVEGERSSLKVPHPFFSDLRVWQAFALAVDRRTIVEQLYGAAGQVTSNILTGPTPFQSPHTRWEFNLDKAAQLLEQAGWKRGSDGVRIKGGRRMQVVYHATANLRSQKGQAIVKQALERIGVEVELKAIPAGVMFSNDPGNPDTYSHFYADMQLNAVGAVINPEWIMRQYVSWEIAQKANNWTGGNVRRWANAEFDRLWQQAKTELDPAKRAALFIRMNDLVIEDVVVIPVVWVKQVYPVSHTLRGLALSAWDWPTWSLAYWYREP